MGLRVHAEHLLLWLSLRLVTVLEAATNRVMENVSSLEKNS